MEMTFKFAERVYKEPPRYKLKYKIPMQKKVIDVKGQVWAYEFVDGKIRYILLYKTNYENTDNQRTV